MQYSWRFLISVYANERARRIPEGLLGRYRTFRGKLEIAAGQIRSESRRRNVNTVKGLIQDYFEDREPPALNHGSGAAIQFENALRRSRIETAAFECKQGLLRLDSMRIKEPELLSRIVETICGIANLGPASSGAVFIGVADKPADKNRIEELDGIQAASIGARYCVGVDREVTLLGTSVEAVRAKYRRSYFGVHALGATQDGSMLFDRRHCLSRSIDRLPLGAATEASQ